MTKHDTITFIMNSTIMKKWHFFQYHFGFYAEGMEHILAKSIINMVVEIENITPKVGVDYLEKIASINGKPNDRKHFDQLLQVLAELMIVHKAITYDWSENPVFAYEPTAGTSNKNPELTITTSKSALGIEVKAPEYVKKHNERGTKPNQMPSRSDIVQVIDKQETMLPRDNPIKIFL